jgi:hypothetical protein
MPAADWCSRHCSCLAGGHLPLAGVSLGIRPVRRYGWVESKEFFGGLRIRPFSGNSSRVAPQGINTKNPPVVNRGILVFLWVRKGGLEPPRPKAQEPKSCVSANFTTRARRPAGVTQKVRRRMPVFIVALPRLDRSRQRCRSGVQLQVAAQLGDMAGSADVVLGERHLALRIHHDG